MQEKKNKRKMVNFEIEESNFWKVQRNNCQLVRIDPLRRPDGSSYLSRQSSKQNSRIWQNMKDAHSRQGFNIYKNYTWWIFRSSSLDLWLPEEITPSQMNECQTASW